MSIEAEVFIAPQDGPNKVLESETIGANDSKIFDDSSLPAKVFVACDLDGRGGAVIIQNPEDVEAKIYESMDDKHGKFLNPEKPIRLSIGQEVLLWSYNTEKELSFYVDDSGDGVPIEPLAIIASS